MANPTIITFLAEWDESVGPKIIDTYPESKKLELESITMQIFASFQAVFGTSGDVSFDRTNLILPLKSQKVTAKILLDAYKNKAVRGGRLPFVVVFLVPVQFVQRELDVYNDIQEEIVDHYTSKKEIKLAEYYDKIVNETSKLAEKVLDEAESSLKDKEYEEAVEQFRNVLFLKKMVKDTSLVDEVEKKLGVALGKYANDVYNQGNEKVKHDDLAEAEKDYMQALKIANESKNEGWIKQYSKKLDDFYHSWLKQLEKEVKSASKEGADAKAMAKIIKTALKIAKKTKNEKVIAKYEDELKQYQPAATPASNE